MNKVLLIGRVTADLELKHTESAEPMAYTYFSIAVNRDFKNKEGKYDTDFIRCIAWGNRAETLSKYVKRDIALW